MINKKEEMFEALRNRKYMFITEFCKEIFDSANGAVDVRSVFAFLKLGVREIFKEELIIKEDGEDCYTAMVDNERLFSVSSEEVKVEREEILKLLKDITSKLEERLK